MTKKERLTISIGALVGGFLLCGFSMTSGIGPPVSTICVAVGLTVGIGGFISLIMAVKRPG